MNKNLKTKKLNTNKGITLIALILTIIVLLILAVVAIQAVQGDGILAHARNAKAEYQNAQNNEAATLQNYTDYITQQSGNNPPKEETYVKVAVNEKASANGTINGEAPSADNPIIPKGFTPIDTETSQWGDGNTEPNVERGLVITDNLTEGNEFVWVPVPTLSDFAVYQRNEKDRDANGRINYRGVLYNFDPDKSKNTKIEWSASGYREPSNLNSSYESTAKLPEWTLVLYRHSFNAMVESVAKYGGFYVGRYEMSEKNGKAQSKQGTKSLQNTTDANNWYRLYSKAKTYDTANSSVTSEMIWGCQWDAMMRWMQENGIDVTSENPTDPGRNKEASYNTGNTTGDDENDCLNNIFDLLGSQWEWTQEAYYNNTRVTRGGSVEWGGPACTRDGFYEPTSPGNYGDCGSRLTLYVN